MDCPYVEGSSPYLVLLYSSIFCVRESKYSRFESYELKLEIFVWINLPAGMFCSLEVVSYKVKAE